MSLPPPPLHLMASASAITLLALGCAKFPSIGWSVSCVVKACWPIDVSLAAGMQQWAWTQWEAPVASRQLPPDKVRELAIGEVPEDRSQPFIVRGLLNSSSSPMIGADYSWLMRPPLGELVVDYFTNASVKDGITPNARAPLADVVRRIVAGGTEKIGTEMIFRRFPHLLDELKMAELVAPLIGSASHIDAQWLGSTLTVPVFMATGKPQARTDLHCEPIANLVMMLGGSKTWTLVDPSQSFYLKPTLSPDGRAYFVSSVDPTVDPAESLAHVRRWVVETGPGDVLWVPTWTWHRVDYHDGETALSASLFHFRAGMAAANNALFTGLVVPNMIKEVVGWKTQ